MAPNLAVTGAFDATAPASDAAGPQQIHSQRTSMIGCSAAPNEQLLLPALAAECGPQAGRYHMIAPQQKCGR